MKILIDLTALSYHITGIERYALCIAEYMIKQDKESEYILVFRNEVYHTFKKYIDNKHVKARILYGNNKLLFNQIILPMKLYGIKADIYLFLAFTSPILFFKKGIITTIHDMGAWDWAEALTIKQRVYCRVGCTISARNAKKIITVSNFSKSRISKILKINNNKISVVYSAISDNLLKKTNATFKDVKNKYGIPSKYIMTLSTVEPRKNMKLLLDAYVNIQDKVDYDLVLVGRKGWKVDELMKNIDVQQRVHFTGFVEDDEVATIYKHAMCFVFPTAYEGFGLPPVEALAMGTPVLSSDAASMPEILRGQVLYFESNNIKELEQKLINLENMYMTMPRELDDYQRNNYCFSKAAAQILRIIKDV